MNWGWTVFWLAVVQSPMLVGMCNERPNVPTYFQFTMAENNFIMTVVQETPHVRTYPYRPVYYIKDHNTIRKSIYIHVQRTSRALLHNLRPACTVHTGVRYGTGHVVCQKMYSIKGGTTILGGTSLVSLSLLLVFFYPLTYSSQKQAGSLRRRRRVHDEVTLSDCPIVIISLI